MPHLFSRSATCLSLSPKNVEKTVCMSSTSVSINDVSLQRSKEILLFFVSFSFCFLCHLELYNAVLYRREGNRLVRLSLQMSMLNISIHDRGIGTSYHSFRHDDDNKDSI